jgi:hyperosmotically inducible protein
LGWWLRYSVRHAHRRKELDGMDRGNSLLQVLVMLVSGVLLAACAALIVGGEPSGGHDTASRGVAQTSHDAAITSSINSRFVHDSEVDALAIRVTTWQGVVTLQGSVRSQAVAARAVDLARSTPNVRRVVSRLTVTP